ncbi:hypothetical protein MU852_03650 [Brevundimonas albigilva]|uniref:hypothetical protein n=1 Tax=Brevundimonas albigilva TaxID=1312364 RepID=UPI00201B49DD|nr:hypothetical protein [Brevundimonas albigilva]UQV18973.1 hypothetical protein MU852_03650 [Brevundimonas albigilva]
MGPDLRFDLPPVRLVVKAEPIGDPRPTRGLRRLLASEVGLTPAALGVAIHDGPAPGAFDEGDPEVGVEVQFRGERLPQRLRLRMKLERFRRDARVFSVALDGFGQHERLLVGKALPRLQRLSHLQGQGRLFRLRHLAGGQGCGELRVKGFGGGHASLARVMDVHPDVAVF